MLPGMLTDSSDALYSTYVRTYVSVRHVCVFVGLGIYMSGGEGDGEEWIRVLGMLQGVCMLQLVHSSPSPTPPV